MHHLRSMAMTGKPGWTRSPGFTLLELLIAMSITVMIGAVSYRFLDSAINASERGAELMDEVARLERFWLLLSSDLEHIANRPLPRQATGVDALQSVLGDAGERIAMLADPNPAVSVSALTGRQGGVLWLSRHGWINPLNLPRSELQRVLYRLDADGTLYREYWPETNQPPGLPPAGGQVMLTDVEQLSLRFLPVGAALLDDVWVSGWPVPDQTLVAESDAEEEDDVLASRRQRLPAAVEVTLRIPSMGEIRRLFVLPTARAAAGEST